MSAKITFSLGDRTYVYAGAWPEPVVDELLEARSRISVWPDYPEYDALTPFAAIVREAGGEIILVEGAREDGSVWLIDMPGFEIN